MQGRPASCIKLLPHLLFLAPPCEDLAADDSPEVLPRRTINRSGSAAVWVLGPVRVLPGDSLLERWGLELKPPMGLLAGHFLLEP